MPDFKPFKVGRHIPSSAVGVCPFQVRGQRGVFCCVGGGPKQLLEIKLWKSPTVNIGLASAIGKSDRMCKSHLDSFYSGNVTARQQFHPNSGC